ncbi:Vesicle-fusing ATPase [Phytophthora cinnamomi]|uniref:Vesicle-fusing ATPase n=1 Tax=Phytophthora cinnamomi TaxID=4785 RepID=UPI0035598709|nr:Vesicle-fusing ATPase [Phytophthora cinnamomi]
MMTLPADEVPPPPSSRGGSSSAALVLATTDDDGGAQSSTLVASASQSDLELHLLQTFAAFAGQQLLHSYLSVKHATRVTRFLADVTESLASRSGLAALVRVLFAQYMRLGHPLVQQVDDAMGKRVIDAVVAVLMLAEQQPASDKQQQQTGILALEAGSSSDKNDAEEAEAAATRPSNVERFQALLLGEVPRMEQELLDARRQAQEEAQAEAARRAPPPVVMELKDFVPVDEVARLKEQSKEQQQEAAQEAARLRAQMAELTREKQRLEQRLTDVHNYQESERGRRFQDMEEELARTKLEANQKAHDLRKLELVVEALQRKHRKKSKSSSRKDDNQSNASESAPPSPVPEHRAKKGMRKSVTA